MALSPERLLLSEQGLGASEAPMLLGLSPFASPLDLWNRKLGKSKPFEGSRYTDWGELLEDDIAEMYARRNGVMLVSSQSLVKELPICKVFCTPDRVAYHKSGASDYYGLECKNKAYSQRSKWGPSGTNQIPTDSAAQAAWSMWVTGWERWDVAVLIGGNDWREYQLAWRPELGPALERAATEFWDSVINKREPKGPTVGALRAIPEIEYLTW
jgi:putative phage-type endonuclease